MNGVCLWMYLPRKEISTEDIIELMHELMLFKPTGFRSSQKARQFRRLGCKNIWEQLRINLEQDAKFRTTADTGRDAVLHLKSEPVTDTLEVHLRLSEDQYGTVHEIVQRFEQTHPIVSAALCTHSESMWNGYANFISNGINKSVERCKAEHPELPEIRTDKMNLIDNSQFPGYSTSHHGAWFGCRCEMWFGRAYDAYIPLDLLTAFQDCAKNETLETGTVHIFMYDSPDDFRSPKSVRRAFAYRIHTDYLNRAEVCHKRLGSSPEARQYADMIIEDGVCTHGGFKRVQTFLDENGVPVSRNRASQVHISERGTDGKAVFEETVPMDPEQ